MILAIQPILRSEILHDSNPPELGIKNTKECAFDALLEIRRKTKLVVKDFAADLPDILPKNDLFLWFNPCDEELEVIKNLDETERSKIILFNVPHRNRNVKEIIESVACAGLISEDSVSTLLYNPRKMHRMGLGIFGYKKLFNPQIFDLNTFESYCTENYGLFYSHNVLELDQLLLMYTRLLFSVINDETEDLTSKMD